MNAKTEKQAMEMVEMIADCIKRAYGLYDAMYILKKYAKPICEMMRFGGYGEFYSFSDFLKWIEDNYEKAGQRMRCGCYCTRSHVSQLLAYCRGMI